MVTVKYGKNGKTYIDGQEAQDVLLNTPKGEKLAYYVTGEILARNKKPFMCSCTGNTMETATPFELDYPNRKMVCPKCGKTVEIIKTAEDFEREEKERIREAQENVKLCFVDQSISSGIKYYELSTRIEYGDWGKVKDLFFYKNYDEDDEEQDTFGMSKLTGWLTTVPQKVEERLNVKPELRLEYRNKKAEEASEKRKKLNKEKNTLKKEIMEHFESENAVYPWTDESIKGTQGASMIKPPKGEEFEDPQYPFDIYGGGRSWIIDKPGNKIWQLLNNGHDGDNWGLNNVATGGAGAIGEYVKYSEKLEKLIKQYINLFQGD